MILVLALVAIAVLAVVQIVATINARRGDDAERVEPHPSKGPPTEPAEDLDVIAHARFDPLAQAPFSHRRWPVLAAMDTFHTSPEALGVTRRRFLNRAIVLTEALGLGAFATASLAFLWPSRTAGFGGKVIAGRLTDILTYIRDKRIPFYIPAGRVYIAPYPKQDLPQARKAYRDETKTMGMDDGIVALYQRCVHLGCRVPFCSTSQWFECPCHGSKYSRVGEKTGGPAPRGLDRFAVEINDNTLVVNTGLLLLGPSIGTDTTHQEAEGPHCVTI